jgi:uncharacterized RDD family membrane protein YckC
MSGDSRYRIETPEQIEVEFELAALGSRFCAALIDALMIGAAMAALGLIAAVIGGSYLASIRDRVGPGSEGLSEMPIWVLSLLISLFLLIPFGGYFIVFELVMRGQTPGKRVMRLRAIRDDGTPMAATDVLVRNLLRFVDFLPLLYGVGAAVMFFHPLSKRLGDIAAGTVVVKEGELDYRAHADKKYELRPAVDVVANERLTPAERRLLVGFLRRRDELLPEARERLAKQLAEPLHAKYGGTYDHPEAYLQRLSQGRHDEP